MATRPLLPPFFHHGFLHTFPYKSALELAFNSLTSPRLGKTPDTPTDCNFEIEDLLDFPNEDEAAAAVSPVVVYAASEGHLLAFPAENTKNFSEKVVKEEEDPSVRPSAGLSVPPEELVDELEWLSTFNEDSSYTGDTQLASFVSSGGLGRSLDSPRNIPKRREPLYVRSPVSVLEQNEHCRPPNSSFILSHLHKPKGSRSSRSRGRVWSLNILQKPMSLETRHKVLHGTSSLSMNGTVDISSPFCLHHERPVCKKPKKASRSLSCSGEEGFHNLSIGNIHNGSKLECSPPMTESGDASLQDHYNSEKPVCKKPKRSVMCENPAAIRRCSHCLVQKTPQWRAGPLGPKTLCNACGVRYKSGRLLPEYRPASSPTFISDVHSNSHRRILEMRQARELEVLSASNSAKMQEEDECTSLSASSDKSSSSSSCGNLPMSPIKDVNEGCQMHEEICVNSKEISVEHLDE